MTYARVVDTGDLRIRSLVWATDIDVLPADHVAERRTDHVVVRSPSNPGHYWGNWLLFDKPAVPGDGDRWERAFEAEFGSRPEVAHRTFGWDRIDGHDGAVDTELLVRGYELERTVGLVAEPEALRPHPRQNTEVRVRLLDPAPDGDPAAWEQVVQIQLDSRDPREDRTAHELFTRRRLDDLRALFADGRGGWYVALDPRADTVVASLGIVVTDGRARFQAVDTAAEHRRQGICSRLVVEAADDAVRRWQARQFVIAADPAYHALGLYQSLGFEPREHVAGVLRRPPS